MNSDYRALVSRNSGDHIICEVVTKAPEDLPDGDVTILVAWSSVNYKDGLASIAKGGVVRNYPRVLGIDLGGTAMDSTDSPYTEGDEVLVTGRGQTVIKIN